MPTNQNRLFIVAHPDDAETLVGHAIAQDPERAWVIIGTNGEESTINLSGDPAFVASGKRRLQSEAGLCRLGVPLENQYYAELPDGGLVPRTRRLAHDIIALSMRHNIRQFITLGAHGYDGHTDHIASYQSARLARSLLVGHTGDIELLALNAKGNGSLIVTGNPAQKLRAMACHSCQFAIFDLIDATMVPDDCIVIDGVPVARSFWESFGLYHPLMYAETYDQQ